MCFLPSNKSLSSVFGRILPKETVSKGITFGSALAMIISYAHWQSIGWAIFHGLLSWGYVIYYAIKYL